MMEEYAPPRYKLLGRVGEGVHGLVIKAVDQENNQYVAIKKLSLKNKNGGVQLSTLREIKVLQNCTSEHVSRKTTLNTYLILQNPQNKEFQLELLLHIYFNYLYFNRVHLKRERFCVN